MQRYRNAYAAWQAAAGPSAEQFARALGDVEQAQRERLRLILAELGPSAIGREHSLKDVRTAERFRERVPVRGFENFQPWVDRIARGERGVLARSPVKLLCPTSGSSGGRKLIPITEPFLDEYRAGLFPWFWSLPDESPAIRDGPAFWTSSPGGMRAEITTGGLRVGFFSDAEYLGPAQAQAAAQVMAVSPELSQIDDFGIFAFCIWLGLLRRRDLRFLSLWNATYFLVLLDHLSERSEELRQALRDGIVPQNLPLPSSVREMLNAQLRQEIPRRLPDGDLGAEPGNLWPDLALISCWCDAMAASSADRLQKRFPGVPIQPKGLLASEGVVTLPFRGARPLAVRSHFFEFRAASGETFFPWELEFGGDYQVILTASNGLCRYLLGDWVRVEGFYETTPCLTFMGRGEDVSDLVGEKLHARHVLHAFAQVGISGARLVPQTDPQPHYILVLPEDQKAKLSPSLLQRLEVALRSNPYFRHARDVGQLGPLRSQFADPELEKQDWRSAAEGAFAAGAIKPKSIFR